MATLYTSNSNPTTDETQSREVLGKGFLYGYMIDMKTQQQQNTSLFYSVDYFYGDRSETVLEMCYDLISKNL